MSSALTQGICCYYRVVLAQVGGSGEGGDLPPAPEFFYLRDFLAANPLTRDGDAWLDTLMAQERGQMLGTSVAGRQLGAR